MNALFPLIRSQRPLRVASFNLFDRIFADSPASPSATPLDPWIPAIDIVETPQQIVVRVEVPGMDKKDLDITLSDGLLTIRGDKRAEQKNEQDHHLILERRFGRFSRTLRIPEMVDIAFIDANYKNGLLTVTLPKRLEETPKRVAIQSQPDAIQA
jgi:HSP20 family protein